MSADTTKDAEEQILIRELSTNYKYSEAPTSNKLTNLRDLNSFLIKLRLVFNRFPGMGKIMYQTVAATNPDSEFKANSLPELPIVKAEPGTTTSSSEEREILKILSADKLRKLKQELTSTGPINNMREFRAFMEDTSFSEVIDEHTVLLHYVAPFLKGGAVVSKNTVDTILDQHRSLEYERSLVLAEPKTGFVILSDTTGYVLPAQDRVTFGD
jgi:hypothetical protein